MQTPLPTIPLLPCPFCGGKAAVIYDECTNPAGYYVECDINRDNGIPCGEMGHNWGSGEYYGEFETPEQATASWNRRAFQNETTPHFPQEYACIPTGPDGKPIHAPLSKEQVLNNIRLIQDLSKDPAVKELTSILLERGIA